MAELVVKIPGVRLDKKSKFKLKEDIKFFMKLKLTRDLLLKRWEKLLEKSKLTSEECAKLSKIAEQDMLEEWKKKGWI